MRTKINSKAFEILNQTELVQLIGGQEYYVVVIDGEEMRIYV